MDDAKLEDICKQAHARSEKRPGEIVFATYYTRKLEFSEKYQPIAIDMIFYLLGGDANDNQPFPHFYLTKGLNPECVFYLNAVSPTSRFHRLDKHVCGIKIE
jgi:hypothetical protein